MASSRRQDPSEPATWRRDGSRGRGVATGRPRGPVFALRAPSQPRGPDGCPPRRRGSSPGFGWSRRCGRVERAGGQGTLGQGDVAGTRARAHSQAQAVDFRDFLGRQIPLDMRIGSVARLGGGAVDVWFEDPDPGDEARVYEADPDELLHAYYEPVRDLIAVYGSVLPEVDDAPGFGSAPLPGTNLSLAVHRRIGGVLDEPDVLRAVRAELRGGVGRFSRSQRRRGRRPAAQRQGEMVSGSSLSRRQPRSCLGTESSGRCSVGVPSRAARAGAGQPTARLGVGPPRTVGCLRLRVMRSRRSVGSILSLGPSASKCRHWDGQPVLLI